ncbi:methyltransferase domain-containing protein [Candidatus Parabeggiatoa sp. HSG14]|uniref:methyltransferase domain-containing protein n=1 Tax=Candidatus Parabeggiatoa sp. HSG14 TaxID=3055593 RepID=UPI0025A7F656|nr:GNAT family N-acetyltransferase [Thiotrichales bacterium HSG14]
MTDKIYQNNYTDLNFPFNIFAHAFYLQEGIVDYLHYGVFHKGESIQNISVREIQQRSIDLLFSYLPPPPSRILVIDIGLGTTALQLAERGYTVTGISSGSQQVDLAEQQVKNNNVTLESVSFEAFSAPAESYEVIIFQQSAQSIESLTLFNKAHNLLTTHGVILIADEIGLQRTSKHLTYHLPALTYTLAQAKRCGFELVEQIDLSTQTAPMVDYLLWVIEKLQVALLADLKLEPIILKNLLSTLKDYQQKYADGHYGYVLLNFAKAKPPRWKITSVTAQDKNTIRELFSEVFEPQKMSDAFWEWKYGQDRGLGIVAWRDNNMIAHYGGIMREIRYFGQPKRAVQITDVMVSTKERGVLTRSGAFFLTMATFLEEYIGYGAHTWVGYGFPTERHLKLAQHLKLYGTVGKMTELRWKTTPDKPHLSIRFRLLIPHLKKNKLIVDKLWEKMASCLQNSLVGIRDFSHIQHRYLSHPHNHYELLLLTKRFTGKLLGILIIKREEEVCQIMDFIGDLKHIPEAIKQVQRIAGNWGMQQIKLWITENFVTAFPLQDAEQQPLDILIPHNIWSQSFPPEEIDGHWWLMGGDTDFL